MRFKDAKGEDLWNNQVEINSDPYGSGVMRFAERWVTLMEDGVNGGKKVADIAHDTSMVADSEGITGFMYGCAVKILSQVWEHGEELRRWHNHDTQIGDEGDRANEGGGILNPAVLVVS